MRITDEIRQKQIDFEKKRRDEKKRFEQLNQLRKEFLHKFPLEIIKDLPIDQYIVGKGSKDSFCYWIETRLRDLGNIKGGTTAGNKFGIYFGRTKSDTNKEYRFPRKYGTTYNEAYDKIKSELYNLLTAGINKDFAAIENNILSPMFKGKILATYYPDLYLNIFSREYLKFYLTKLGIIFSESDTDLELKEKLIRFKNLDLLMKNWTIDELGWFLWESYKRPAKRDEVPIDVDYNDIELPPLQKVRIKIINPKHEPLTNQNKDHEKNIRHNFKPDYIKNAKRNTLVGERGEKIILKNEKDNLIQGGRRDLANKVERVSLNSDSFGYDVHSFSIDGKDKYIEVKATTKKYSNNPSFIISDNEYNEGRKLGEQYFINWVFDAATERPEILEIQNPFGKPVEQFSLTPRSYTITFQFKEE